MCVLYDSDADTLGERFISIGRIKDQLIISPGVYLEWTIRWIR